MGTVLVTGGTGVLGSRVASRLVDHGDDVRVLSRQAAPDVGDGVAAVRGDVRTGDGLTEAVAGVDAIVHAATSPRWRSNATEVEGTRNLIEAAQVAQPHLIYASIVGVDRIPFFYYRAKWEAEQVVERASVPWTIQRATQFHSLLFEFMLAGRVPSFAGARAQLIDASEVADRIVSQVEEGPQGRAPDMGGPAVLTLPEIADIHREVTGRAIRLLRVPVVGKAMRAFAEGHNTCPDHAVGTITFADYLRSQRSGM